MRTYAATLTNLSPSPPPTSFAFFANPIQISYKQSIPQPPYLTPNPSKIVSYAGVAHTHPSFKPSTPYVLAARITHHASDTTQTSRLIIFGYWVGALSLILECRKSFQEGFNKVASLSKSILKRGGGHIMLWVERDSNELGQSGADLCESGLLDVLSLS